MEEVFLLCRFCRVVHRVYAARELAAGGTVSEEAAVSYGQFLIEHRHHTLQRLERSTFVEAWDRPLWDPSRSGCMELTNGHERFTVRSWRPTIDAPVSRELVDETIETSTLRLSVEEDALRRALDHHFFPYALRPKKIDSFVAAVQEVLAALPGYQLEPSFDDADDPAVSIARLPDDGCVALLARCMDIFDAWELPRVASFVSANRDEYGALALRVHRDSTLRCD
jgi:hypothetical protein